MAKKKNNLSERSKCCNSKVVVRGRTTLHYVCLACGQACDVIFLGRRTWKINPATKIKEDEREKITDKLSKKEIEEIRKNEDF